MEKRTTTRNITYGWEIGNLKLTTSHQVFV